jgi:iron-sulfur cluster assembly accessory protein
MVRGVCAEEGLMSITVTERAAREIATIMNAGTDGSKGSDGNAGTRAVTDATVAKPDARLRVWVAGAGCSGLRYGLGIDDKEPRADDSVFESNGVRVIVDPRSLSLMDGSVVTWVDDGEASGFSIENPNPAPAGGCGCSDSGCGSGDGGCGSGCGGD